MSDKQFVSFSLGLIISGIINGLIVYFAWIAHLIGNGIFSSINDPVETQYINPLIIAIFVLLIAWIVIYELFKAKGQYAAIGATLPALVWVIIIIVCCVFGIKTINTEYTNFDREIWLKSKEKPFKMVRKLVVRKSLLGMTRPEVTQMLGKADSVCYYGNECMQTLLKMYHSSFVLKTNESNQPHFGWLIDRIYYIGKK